MIYLMTVENLFWPLFLAIILPLDAILFQAIGGSYCILEIAKAKSYSGGISFLIFLTGISKIQKVGQIGTCIVSIFSLIVIIWLGMF